MYNSMRFVSTGAALFALVGSAWAADPPAAPAPAPVESYTPTVAGEDEEVVPMTMLRRHIAQRLVEAQQTAALLTTFNEIDMSAVMNMRKEMQDSFTKRYNINHSDLILQTAQNNGGTFNRANMAKLFAKRSRPPGSVGTSIKSLLTRGLIERIAEGEYKLLRPSKNNGAAPVETEEAHG